MKKSTFIVVGKVGSPYGVDGWLKIHTYTEFGPSILNYNPWYLAVAGDEGKPYKIERGRVFGKGVIVKLAGINSPEEGRRLNGASITVPRAQLPPLKKNEYYWSDLIGLAVINKKGEQLGEVLYLIATGSNDVLVVQGENKKEFGIPYLFNKVILSVDLIKNEIHVDWELL